MVLILEKKQRLSCAYPHHGAELYVTIRKLSSEWKEMTSIPGLSPQFL